MACEFEVLLNQFQYPAGAEQALRALDLVELLESKLSVYKPHSDFSQLNRWAAQRPVAVASDTLAVLELAQAIQSLTDGAFDITAGSLSDVWGFSRRQGQLPSPERIAAALLCVGARQLQLEGDSNLVRFGQMGVQVNPGGIGKGYALDRAAEYLSMVGINDFMMHGGLSSVVARGHRQHPDAGGGWLVSLRHPWRVEQLLGTLRLRDQALATSGSGKQFFHFAGQRYSHIIDPRTGWPAQGMMSTTVVCRSGAVADALATGLFVMGPAACREFCQQNPSVAVIAIYVDAKSGHQTIEAFNADTDLWKPLAESG